MKIKKKRVLILFLFLFLAVLGLSGLALGSARFPLDEVIAVFTGGGDPTVRLIVLSCGCRGLPGLCWPAWGWRFLVFCFKAQRATICVRRISSA